MKKVKFIKAEEVGNLIKNGQFGLVSGFVGSGSPEEILISLEKSFLEKNSPRDLSFMFAAGFGDSKEKGLNHIAHKGMIKEVIAGHLGLAPKLGELVNSGDLIGYNLPQGVISQMFRDMAAGKPATISHVGLGTYVDPDLQGGKLNEQTKGEIVEKIKVVGKDMLLFKNPKPDFAILRGSTADEDGNISYEDEILTLEALAIATAVRNSGGKVFVQVKRKVSNGSIQPKDVKVPGVFVDYIVVTEDLDNHMQTFSEEFNIHFVTGKKSRKGVAVSPLKLDERKVIARRSAMLLTKDKRMINYGIGVPEGVPAILNEEKQESYFVPTVEPGAIGGTPAGGLNFGASINPACIIDQPSMFDFYDGGGLDIAFLGLAQCDPHGNINVSKFGPKIAGCGGFINITQNAKEVVFCGTFTAGGLKEEIKDGKLNIIQEGKSKKFIKAVEQITFSGDLAAKNSKRVVYVTERAVFELKKEGLVLTEIAPGVDLEKDVLAQMDFKPIISPDLKTMDERIFKDERMNMVL